MHFVSIQLKIHPSIHPLIHSLIRSSTHSLIHSLIRSSTHSLIHSLIRSSTHSLIHSFIYSFIHSSTHPPAPRGQCPREPRPRRAAAPARDIRTAHRADGQDGHDRGQDQGGDQKDLTNEI